MDKVKQFNKERKNDIEKMGMDDDLRKKSLEWMLHADKYKYTCGKQHCERLDRGVLAHGWLSCGTPFQRSLKIKK